MKLALLSLGLYLSYLLKLGPFYAPPPPPLPKKKQLKQKKQKKKKDNNNNKSSSHRWKREKKLIKTWADHGQVERQISGFENIHFKCLAFLVKSEVRGKSWMTR